MLNNKHPPLITLCGYFISTKKFVTTSGKHLLIDNTYPHSKQCWITFQPLLKNFLCKAIFPQ